MSGFFWASSNSKADPHLAYGDDGSQSQIHAPPRGKISKFQRIPPKDHGTFKEDTDKNWKTEYEIVKKAFDTNATLWEEQAKQIEELKSSHNAELSDIQRSVFQNLPESHPTRTDDDLRREIKRLRNEITLWAKKWARGSLGGLSAEDLKLFRDHLAQTVLLDPDGVVLQKFISQKKFLWLLLGSLLSYTLHYDIVQNPFFFVKRLNDDKVNTIGDSRLYLDLGYMEMCVYMAGVNVVEAHLWRSERVREFQKEGLKKRGHGPYSIGTQPSPSRERPAVHDEALSTSISPEETNGPMTSFITADHTVFLGDHEDNQCTEARQLFLSGCAGKLIEETSEELQIHLDRIFARAKNLSLDIWSRRSNLVCSFARNLREEVYVELSEKLDPHPFLLSDERSILHNKHFSVLVHPLMELFGNEEGQGYVGGRVLMSAVAWFLPE